MCVNFFFFGPSLYFAGEMWVFCVNVWGKSGDYETVFNVNVWGENGECETVLCKCLRKSGECFM